MMGNVSRHGRFGFEDQISLINLNKSSLSKLYNAWFLQNGQTHAKNLAALVYLGPFQTPTTELFHKNFRKKSYIKDV